MNIYIVNKYLIILLLLGGYSKANILFFSKNKKKEILSVMMFSQNQGLIENQTRYISYVDNVFLQKKNAVWK